MQNTEDLRHYALRKLRSFNEQKALIRDYLSELRQHSTESREAAIAGGVTGDDLETAGITSGFPFSMTGENEAAAQALGLTGGLEADTIQGVDDLIAKWEDKLNTIGDDAQLANVDLQNMLQKQQQTLQMMSNISKALHDTAMAIIRKIGG